MKLPTPERSAQAGIILLFVVIIRSLAEYFRLEHAYGYAIPRQILSEYVGGALIAVVATGICVMFFFARRYRSVVVLVVVTIVALLVYKVRYIL
ncbi:hypothetical protein Acid345_0058 [Candidatus Koribacter versatilis Ellin345]|uniref:Uncharacterized protein n=1 Tax=Koribacter versatilis (strain Ellin345) TaxID=204669 RepID=Q1IVN7_KORVE|nr:hypothetical protein [Candidatus Koribacter versatilis]ABF39063.1 hypothetical protein Acid345_0058 [Candidatus Koribacter versatilis Ellin345]